MTHRPPRSLTLFARTLRAVALGAALVASMLPASASAMTQAPAAGAVPDAAPTASTIRLVKVANVSDPVLAISPKGDTARFFSRHQGRQDPDRQGRHPPLDPVPEPQRQRLQGGARGFWAWRSTRSFATNRRFYVNYTNSERHHRGAPVPGVGHQPGRRQAGLRADDHQDQAALLQPQRRDDRVREGRLPVHRHRRRRQRPGIPATAPRTRASCSGKMLRINVNGKTAKKHYRVPRSNPYVGRPGRNQDLAARPAQPVALVL